MAIEGLTMALTQSLATSRQKLSEAGQAHLLEHFDTLDVAAQRRLLGQIDTIDWPEVARLIDTHVLNAPPFALPDRLEPAPYYTRAPSADQEPRYSRARALGAQLISDGKVAAFTVAGGQGTRLGWDGPKGAFPATPIRKRILFGCLADYLRKAQQKYGSVIPWYIMTSPANDADTRAIFDRHGHFELDPAQVMIFPQAMMPAFDPRTGQVLLAGPGDLALSPNGHGGSLKAIYTSGALDDMTGRGIEQISYTQIDNPAVYVVDPLFIGLHALDGAQMSSKMVVKTDPAERVGVFAVADGRVAVIEYSDLPPTLAEERDGRGDLRFCAGSIAVHVIRADFVRSLNESNAGFALPFHRAEKKVACYDRASGKTIEPGQPNAVKLETFVFDALPLADVSIVLETDRVEEFAPIKNEDVSDPSKCVDSPSTSSRLQIERAARWLTSRGVKVARQADGSADALLEISPLTAIEPDDLDALDLPDAIEPGSKLLL